MRPPAVGVEPSLRRAVLTFVGAAIVVLLVAPQFARSAEGIAELTGVGSTFVGTWLVGLSTSLPELATSLAAVRLRAYDLAVGNRFGSNALNMAVFVVLDPLHAGGRVLGAVSPGHAVTALVAVALMGIAVATLVYRAKGTRALVEPGSLLIVLGYLGGARLGPLARDGAVGRASLSGRRQAIRRRPTRRPGSPDSACRSGGRPCTRHRTLRARCEKGVEGGDGATGEAREPGHPLAPQEPVAIRVPARRAGRLW